MNKNKKMPLIGISGKAGAGKDLVGNIIQYLTACKKYEGMDCFKADYVNKGFDLKANYTNISNWEIKKFADKLKDIVCLLIGCSREQLENREFKEKELGEEWWYWYGYNYKLVTNLHNGRVTKLFKTEEELLELQKLHKIGFKCKQVKLTPRLLLQLLGTECGREILHPNCWVNALFADYREKVDFDNNLPMNKNWIITDVRFPNELKAIKDRGGITIRVNRWDELRFPDKYEEFHNQGDILDWDKFNPIINHESETALDNAKFDYTIENNSTIEELLNKVKKILINEKII